MVVKNAGFRITMCNVRVLSAGFILKVYPDVANLRVITKLTAEPLF